ncbi:MAG: NAD(P)H-hydrate dehydratase [Lachnospiraceae bacterium]|nr:NAD(P)H-hydrate dehydratase [Lachnospiraceae bacterium]
MEIILNSQQMRALDERTIINFKVSSLILMERAGLAVLEAIREENYSLENILVLCGSGNNGGDGFCLARLFAEQGKNVSVFLYGSPDKMTPETRSMYESCLAYDIEVSHELKTDHKDLIIDALFGIGLNRDLRDDVKDIIRKINLYSLKNPGARIVSCDIASGIYADTGNIAGEAIKAHMTVTFAHKKIGQLLYPGKDYTGKLKCKAIGITDRGLSPYISYITALEEADLPLIKRYDSSNKGSYGKLLIIAGSESAGGCAYLSAMAAFKAGAGMVRILTHRENKDFLLNSLPEAMISSFDTAPPDRNELKELYSWADAILIGPGTGKDEKARAIFDSVFTDTDLPLVVDADGISMLREHLEAYDERRLPIDRTIIITPHIKEMSLFTGLKVSDIKEDPIAIAGESSARYGIVCVLKDARTVIADRDGSIRINLSGNNGMSVAGMGDVLAGIILSLLGQGASAFDAASYGAFIHGRAGDDASLSGSKSGLLPRDLIKNIKNYVE